MKNKPSYIRHLFKTCSNIETHEAGELPLSENAVLLSISRAVSTESTRQTLLTQGNSPRSGVQDGGLGQLGYPIPARNGNYSFKARAINHSAPGIDVVGPVMEICILRALIRTNERSAIGGCGENLDIRSVLGEIADRFR